MTTGQVGSFPGGNFERRTSHMLSLVVVSLVAVCGDSVAVFGDSRWVTGPCHVTYHVNRQVTCYVNCHRLGQVTSTSLSLSYVTQYITQGNAQYCKWGFCEFGHFDIVSTWYP